MGVQFIERTGPTSRPRGPEGDVTIVSSPLAPSITTEGEDRTSALAKFYWNLGEFELGGGRLAPEALDDSWSAVNEGRLFLGSIEWYDEVGGVDYDTTVEESPEGGDYRGRCGWMPDLVIRGSSAQEVGRSIDQLAQFLFNFAKPSWVKQEGELKRVEYESVDHSTLEIRVS